MTDSMKKFLEYASAHEDTAKALKELNRGGDEADAKAKLTALAAEAGFAVTDADFAEAKLPEGELTDEQAETASGGDWASFYRSGDTPRFHVGEEVTTAEWGKRYKGTVLAVSDTKNVGWFCKEFSYTVHWTAYRSGGAWQAYDKTETRVYEDNLLR